MGLFGGSSSSSASVAKDQRGVATDSAFVLTGRAGDVQANRTYADNSTTTINTLDGGAIKSSLDTVKATSKDAFGFGEATLDTVDDAFGLVSEIVNANKQATDKVLAASTASLDSALSLADKAQQSESAKGVKQIIIAVTVLGGAYFAMRAFGK